MTSRRKAALYAAPHCRSEPWANGDEELNEGVDSCHVWPALLHAAMDELMPGPVSHGCAITMAWSTFFIRTGLRQGSCLGGRLGYQGERVLESILK